MNGVANARSEPARHRDHEAGPWRASLLAFFVLACVLSWVDWTLVIASDRGWVPFTVRPNPWGSFGPAVAAAAVTAVLAGRRGMLELFRPLAHWRFAARWWVFIVLGPAAMVTLAVAMYAVSGGSIPPIAPPDYAQLAILSLLLLVAGGPVGEEIGWRGFALPRLLERMGAVMASFVIAAVWTVWHLPLFWMPGAAQEGSSIPLFLGLVTAFSVLTTWVYIATGRSLLAAVVFHHGINLSTYFLPALFPGLDPDGRVDRMLLVVAGIAALFAIRAMRRRPREAVR